MGRKRDRRITNRKNLLFVLHVSPMVKHMKLTPDLLRVIRQIPNS